MANLFGCDWTRDALLDRVEDMAQMAGARRVGVARGVSHDEPRYYRHALHSGVAQLLCRRQHCGDRSARSGRLRVRRHGAAVAGAVYPDGRGAIHR